MSDDAIDSICAAAVFITAIICFTIYKLKKTNYGESPTEFCPSKILLIW